jgi:ribosomal protein S21
MGVKVHVNEGEPPATALRRLRKLIEQDNRYPIWLPKPGKRRQDYYQKPSVLRRQKNYWRQIQRQKNLNYFMKRYNLVAVLA